MGGHENYAQAYLWSFPGLRGYWNDADGGEPLPFACTDVAACNGRGQVRANGDCTCDAGYAGSRCQYSDQFICNGFGHVYDADTNFGFAEGLTGLCVHPDRARDYPQLEMATSSCAEGHGGLYCEHVLDVAHCSNHGWWSGSACSCNVGWGGPTCGIYRRTCDDNGWRKDDGTCSCGAQYQSCD